MKFQRHKYPLESLEIPFSPSLGPTVSHWNGDGLLHSWYQFQFEDGISELTWSTPLWKGRVMTSLLVTNTLMRKVCLEPQNPTRTMKLKTILQTARRQMGKLEYGIRTWNGTMETAIVSLIDTWWALTRCQHMCQVLVSYREENMAGWPSEDS